MQLNRPFLGCKNNSWYMVRVALAYYADYLEFQDLSHSVMSDSL